MFGSVDGSANDGSVSGSVVTGWLGMISGIKGGNDVRQQGALVATAAPAFAREFSQQGAVMATAVSAFGHREILRYLEFQGWFDSLAGSAGCCGGIFGVGDARSTTSGAEYGEGSHPGAVQSRACDGPAASRGYGDQVGEPVARRSPQEAIGNQGHFGGEAHPHEAPIDFESLYANMEFFDDVKGGSLDRSKVIAARRLEMDYSKKIGVYYKVPIGEAKRLGAKVITTKWVDTNKGSEVEPNYRSRLVGRELNLSDSPDLVAATPPLDSLRYIVSRCASSQRRQRPHRILFIDVSRAYFALNRQGPCSPRFPMRTANREMRATWGLSLYGNKDAAENSAVEYTRTLKAAGFEPGKASPCNFVHKTRDLALTVHGGDFTATGPIEDLTWLEEALRRNYGIKVQVLGPEAHQAQEVKILGRTLRWTEG